MLAACLTAISCSGATDVVGILDDAPESTEGLSSAAPNPDEALAVVQGRPLPDWRGEMLDWPLSVPLRELFATENAAPREPNGGRYLGASPASAGSSRAARPFSRPSVNGAPSLAGINAARARRGARAAPEAMRSVVLRGDGAERLLSLFAGEAASGMPPAAVVRDENGDIYQIVLDVTARRGDGTALDDAPFDGTPRWRTGQ